MTGAWGRAEEAGWPRWVFGSLAAGAVLFNWLASSTLLPFSPGPDAVLALALALSAAGFRRAAGWVSVAAGLLADLPGGVLLGLGCVSRRLAVELAVRIWSRLQNDTYPNVVLVALVAAVAEGWMALAGGWAFGVGWGSLAGRTVATAQRALLTTGLFAAFYPLAVWLRWRSPAVSGRSASLRG